MCFCLLVLLPFVHFFALGSHFRGTSSQKKNEKYHLSMQLNTDGVALFKSSRVSIWPIFMTLNELPFSLRYKTCLSLSLFYCIKTCLSVSLFFIVFSICLFVSFIDVLLLFCLFSQWHYLFIVPRVGTLVRYYYCSSNYDSYDHIIAILYIFYLLICLLNCHVIMSPFCI